MKDSLGQEIGLGDVIVYATRHASSMDMHVGIVKELRKVTSHRRRESIVIQVVGTSDRWRVREPETGIYRQVTLTAPTCVKVSSVPDVMETFKDVGEG